MKPNMGRLDRLFRIVAAFVIAYLYFFTDMIEGPLGVGLLVLAAVFVVTSFIGFCPLYAPFGMSTRKSK